MRNCVNGWCSGDARPDNHGCEAVPEEDHDVVYDGSYDDCENVTFYSECNYTGEVLEIIDEVSCLDW